MDDETAEIELLEQNLAKTRQISQRMTSILNSFDTRLAKLEKSILPLYTSTQILNRRASNIEKALLKIDEVASNHEGIAAEEALILRGPQPGQLESYKDALERLNASIAFKSSDPSSIDTARLVETGAKKLAQLYTKLVAEGSSGPSPQADQPSPSTPPFPSQLLVTLRPLVSFLRTLPVPTTHPSHPAAASILSTLKEAQRGYADMRGTWSCKCLDPHAKWILEHASETDPIRSGRDFGEWTKTLLSVANEEYALLTDLQVLTTPAHTAAAYNTLLNPILVLFGTTVTSFVAFTKRSLHKYGFMALAAYEGLVRLQGSWEEVSRVRGGGGGEGGRKEGTEFKDALQSVKSVCMRMFPESLADIKLSAAAGAGKGGELNVGLLDTTVQTVQFLNRIPDVLVATGEILLTLGDGKWKMGEGMQVAKPTTTGEVDQQRVLEHYVYDMVLTIVNSLNTISRTQRRPPFDSTFLLNNISYLHRNLYTTPTSPTLLTYLSKPTRDILNSNLRTAKSGYFDANFSPLMQALTDDPNSKSGSGSSRAATKEKFTRFYDLLEEVIERHKVAKVLDDDEGMRKEIGGDVVKFLIPSLKAFTQKQKEKEFSKNPQKYIKLSAEAVENQLRAIYR